MASPNCSILASICSLIQCRRARSGAVELWAQCGGKSIQRGSDGEDLEDLFFGDLPHDKTSAQLPGGEAFRFQPEDRLTNGCSADAELTGQLLLGEPIAGSERAHQDRRSRRSAVGWSARSELGRHQVQQPTYRPLYTLHPTHTYTGGVELSTLPGPGRTRGSWCAFE